MTTPLRAGDGTNKRKWLWLAPVPLVVVVVAHLHGAAAATPSVAVTRKKLVQSVVASGRVLAPAKVQLAALQRGRVVRVGTVEGQHVSAGALLVAIDDTEARAIVLQAEAQVTRAKARLAQVASHDARVAEGQLLRAESELQAVEAESRRTTALVEAHALPPAQADTIAATLARAREQRDTARLRLDDTLPTGGEARLAAAALLEAQAQLSVAKLRLEQLQLVAPGNGTVFTRSVEVGDVVEPGRALMSFVVDGPTRLTIAPDERALGVLQLGQAAKASAEAFPHEAFEARVDWIAPGVDEARGTIEVRLLVDAPPPYLRPDMTVSVTVLVGERPNVVALPLELVHDAETSTPWVMVSRGRKQERVDVQLGLRGARDVEIVAGLTPDDAVVPPATAPQAKQKIHPWD
jgi:HlyD family secretion protein